MLPQCLNDGLLYCPTCRGIYDGEYRDSHLCLGDVYATRGERIQHAFLKCESCPSRYPVIDGIAVLVREPQAFIRQMDDATLWRDDLPSPLHHWLVSCRETSDPAVWRRQMLAVYSNTLQKASEASNSLTQSMNHTIDQTCEFLRGRLRRALTEHENPVVLDAGCGVGDSALFMAEQGARVIAVDHDLGALRVLASLAVEGRASVPHWRHGGNDFETREIQIDATAVGNRILPIAADMLNPPLGSNSIDLATAYHLLDNVPQPLVLLRQIHAVLKPAGSLLLSTPYDWSDHATESRHRLGEAIRADDDTDPAVALRALLQGQLNEWAPELRFEIEYESTELPWILQRHRRSFHVFLCHYLEAVKQDL